MAVVDNELVLSLANVRNDQDFTYLRLKVINKTNIDYNVDFTDFQLVENAQSKFLGRKKKRGPAPAGALRRATQPGITGRTTGYLTYAIPLYAATERGYLEVTLRELNGARVLVLPVPSRLINRLPPFNAARPCYGTPHSPHPTGTAGSSHAQDEQPASPAAALPVKRTPAQLLRANWLALAGLLLVLIFGGLFLWLQSARQAARQQREPVAAASANIEPAIARPTAPAGRRSRPRPRWKPSAAPSRSAERPGPASDQQVIDVFAVDTTGQALRRRRKAQTDARAASRRAEANRLAAAAVDTMQTTVQDPTTGSYRAKPSGGAAPPPGRRAR